MNRGIKIDFETADKITLATLKDSLSYLEKEYKDYKKGKQWMHPEDAEKSKEELIPSFKTIIKYYGG